MPVRLKIAEVVVMTSQSRVLRKRTMECRAFIVIALTSLLHIGGASASPQLEPLQDENLGRLVQGQPSAHEQKMFAIIAAQQPVKPRFISQRDVALLALQQNLLLKVDQAGVESAQAALAEAEAIFDPVFNVNITTKQNRTFERTLQGTIYRKALKSKNPLDTRDQLCNATILALTGTTPEECKGDNGDPRVIKIGYRQATAGNELTDIIASSDNDGGTAAGGGPESTTVKVGLSQMLPWGGSLSITEDSTFRQIYADHRANKYGDNGNWSASAVLGISMPVPGTKGFGEFSAQRMAMLLAEKARDAKFWEVKESLNQILYQVDSLFWELVQAHERLLIALDGKALSDRQLRHVERMMERGLSTRFGVAQVKTENASSAVAVAEARQAVANASIKLAQLIGEGDEVMFVPALYEERIVDPVNIKSLQQYAKETRTAQRPSIRSHQIRLESGAINTSSQKNGLLPALTVSGSWSGSQSNDQFAYSSAVDALSNLSDPDSKTKTFGMSYQKAIGDKVVTAKYRTAVAEEGLASIALRKVKNQAQRELSDALMALYTLHGQRAASEKGVELSQLAYDKLLHKQSIGADVSELDIVLTVRNLVAQRAVLMDTNVEVQKARAKLMLATGEIANHYIDQTAETELDQLRAERMADKGLLSYFLPNGSSPLAIEVRE